VSAGRFQLVVPHLMSECLLTVDLGTTALKTTLFD